MNIRSIPSRCRQFLLRVLNGLSVGQKVMSILFVEILSYSVITSVAIFQIHVVGNEVKQMANVYLPLFSASEAIRLHVQDKQLNLKDVVFVGDRVVYDKEAEEAYTAARAKFLTAASGIDDQIQSSETMIVHSLRADDADASVIATFASELKSQLSRIRFANRLNDGRVDKVFETVEDGSFLMGMELLRGVSSSEAALLDEIGHLDRMLFSLKTASVDYTISVERASSLMTLLASILTVCMVITVFYYVVNRNISRPLLVLTDAIRSFDIRDNTDDTHAERDLSIRRDELGTLARSFGALRHELRAQDRALRLSKEAAERADRAKSQFLAAASHDLRQPLHAMQMYLAALRHRLSRKEDLDILHKIESVSITVGRLLNSLLDVSQLEAGAIKPQFESFPVQEMLRRLSLSFAPVAQKKGLVLRVVPSSAVVHSDPVLLERIVGNFLSNAIRYTESGKVVVGCRRLGEDVMIQVVDSGVGIPEDKMDAVFEDFHQLHNAERDRGKGLGLGLGIARRLSACLEHSIESRSVLGRGSCFGVVVARGDVRTNAAHQAEVASFPDRLAGTRIMLVEDDLTVAEAMILLLETWKCRVVWAADSREALDLMARAAEKPSIILADYRLPGDKDGVQVATALQLAAGRAIPTIIITGESELDELREISELGYTVLRKPVRPAKLRSLLNHYLSQG
jgi:signal transduction histidine kinase